GRTRAVRLQPLDRVALADELVTLRLDDLVVADLGLELRDVLRQLRVVRVQIVDVGDLRAVEHDDPDEGRREHDHAHEELALPLLASFGCLYRQQVDSDHWNLSPGERSASPSDTIACGPWLRKNAGSMFEAPASRNGSTISTGTRARCSIAASRGGTR